MKIDNSRTFEEKFQEGYTKRCNELVHANLVLIETDLYELTDSQYYYFLDLREHANSNIDKHNVSLDYVKDNGILLNTVTHGYNY